MDTPSGNSIREIRRSLGLNSEQLGSRVGKAGVTVRYLEKAESTRAATLASLGELANAMDHELVILYRSRTPVSTQIKNAAEIRAKTIVDRVATSMAMENQHLAGEDRSSLLESLTNELIANPKLLHR
ncbi:MAG TPA: hypothetical protein VIB80_02930 [Aquiluna sp.]